MVKISWIDGGTTGTSKGKIIKTIEKEWDGIKIKDILESAKKLLEIPKTSIITLYLVNNRQTSGDYELKNGDEVNFVTTTINEEILKKKVK